LGELNYEGGGCPLFVKSSKILVFKEGIGGALTLINKSKGRRCSLNGQQAAFWSDWDIESLKASIEDAGWRELLEGNFIFECDHAEEPKPSAYDAHTPQLGVPNVKWYTESADLCLLFDTRLTSEKNALLLLSPYGSFCWRGICNGDSVHRIRKEALRIFGCDEVLPFLLRLSSIGFVKPIAGCHHDATPQLMTKEFFPPDIQFRIPHAAIPWYCLWELCTTCDLRCKTCYLPNFSKQGPDKKKATHIIRQIIDTGIFFVSLMGGEVLLLKELEFIVATLREAGIFVKIITNGQTLTLSRARSLARAGLNQVEVSFDGLTQSVHENSRGADTFTKALDALGFARKAGIPRVGMVYTVHSGNISEIERLPAFMRDTNVKECYISLFKKTGLLGSRCLYNSISLDAIESIRTAAEKWQNANSDLTIVLNTECSCGRTSVVIGANGDVRVCSFSYAALGNVFESDLGKIWRTLGASILPVGPTGYCAQ
jgi:MoaA/NifB/PqqE/SkfB family radical SAM enzyme